MKRPLVHLIKPPAKYSKEFPMQNPIFALLAVVMMAGVAVDSTLAAAQAANAPGSAGSSALVGSPTHEGPFLAENNAAMDKMMAGMAVKPIGDVDADFAAMMIPHHQGAIDMALAELRYGKNEQLRRIAQEIIVDQQQEIAAMRLALGQPLPPSTAAPTQIQPQPPARNTLASSMQMQMRMNMREDKSR
jgi:Domain of unknown function (DUF305)